jgi:hypothetical protein
LEILAMVSAGAALVPSSTAAPTSRSASPMDARLPGRALGLPPDTTVVSWWMTGICCCCRLLDAGLWVVQGACVCGPPACWGRRGARHWLCQAHTHLVGTHAHWWRHRRWGSVPWRRATHPAHPPTDPHGSVSPCGRPRNGSLGELALPHAPLGWSMAGGLAECSRVNQRAGRPVRLLCQLQPGRPPLGSHCLHLFCVRCVRFWFVAACVPVPRVPGQPPTAGEEAVIAC